MSCEKLHINQRQVFEGIAITCNRIFLMSNHTQPQETKADRYSSSRVLYMTRKSHLYHMSEHLERKDSIRSRVGVFQQPQLGSTQPHNTRKMNQTNKLTLKHSLWIRRAIFTWYQCLLWKGDIPGQGNGFSRHPAGLFPVTQCQETEADRLVIGSSL